MNGRIIDWLFPQVRKNVLTLLLMDPGRRCYLREIARRTGCAVGTVWRELKGLVACGVICETREGNRTYYQANSRCPAYPELLGLIRKTSGLADVLAGALGALGDRVAVAFVYGSQARQDARPDSDVDLMVIGQVGFAEVVQAVAETHETLGREVNPTVYHPREFKEKIASGHHFLRSVLKEPKVFLVGDADELGKLAE